MSSPARLPTGKANKRVHITDAGDKTVGKGGKGAAKNDAARTSGGPSKKGRKAASSDGDGESGADTDRVMQQDISGPDAVNLSRRELTDLALLPDSEDKAKVFVNGNALTRLKGIERATGARMLFAQDNKLESQALMDIAPLEELVVFNAANNNISKIPSGAFQNQTKLKALILTNNKITELKHIKHLGGLTTLVLGKNLLSQLPSLSGLAALNKLTLSSNNLAMFPDVSGCPHLAELRLNDNSITTVPKTVVASLALRVLDLGNNPIMEWKNVRELRHLPRLVNLSLKGTPLSEMPSYAAESLVRFPHLLIMDYKRRPDKPAPHPLLLALKAGPTVDAADGVEPVSAAAADAPKKKKKQVEEKKGREEKGRKAPPLPAQKEEDEDEEEEARVLSEPEESSDGDDEDFFKPPVPPARMLSVAGAVEEPPSLPPPPGVKISIVKPRKPAVDLSALLKSGSSGIGMGAAAGDGGWD